MKTDEICNRTPDKETESLRIWNSKPNEVIEDEEEDGFEVESENGMKIKCIGFTKIFHKETKELLFAYKFKHEKKFVLYYMPKETPQAIEVFEFLDYMTMNIGYGLQDIKETLKGVQYELKIADKENERAE